MIFVAQLSVVKYKHSVVRRDRVPQGRSSCHFNISIDEAHDCIFRHLDPKPISVNGVAKHLYSHAGSQPIFLEKVDLLKQK